MRALRSLLTMCHQDKKYNEGIYKRLYSALLNLKLVGGNMHPEELQAKRKVINISCSYEATAVTMEYKLMETLLNKS